MSDDTESSAPALRNTHVHMLLRPEEDQEFERMRALVRDPRTGRMPTRSTLFRRYLLAGMAADRARIEAGEKVTL